eukprot:TRINITY_DN18395_c0_g1_i1.p1 TRINITY_DN18395_c0_g1~~TRINITY_DN18395_c0_g1_i1.p1  ORF type:complete len:186 (+),score=31.08 TRINITY_DN18395_c0_g1_i1:83-640(+)
MMSYKYWSIPDILASQTCVFTTFQTACPSTGQITKSRNGPQEVKEGQALALPIWLARPLKQNGIIDVAAPPAFQENNKRALAADPCYVNLGARVEYYHTAAKEISELTGDEDLMSILEEASETRRKRIREEVKAPIPSKSFFNFLSAEEKTLYSGARKEELTRREKKVDKMDRIHSSKLLREYGS